MVDQILESSPFEESNMDFYLVYYIVPYLQEWTTQPNYAILVDERDRAIPQLAYVPQEKLELASETINHFLGRKYFERWDLEKKR